MLSGLLPPFDPVPLQTPRVRPSPPHPPQAGTRYSVQLSVRNPPPTGALGAQGTLGLWAAPVDYKVLDRLRAVYSVRGDKYGAMCAPRAGAATVLYDACAVRFDCKAAGRASPALRAPFEVDRSVRPRAHSALPVSPAQEAALRGFPVPAPRAVQVNATVGAPPPGPSADDIATCVQLLLVRAATAPAPPLWHAMLRPRCCFPRTLNHRWRCESSAFHGRAERTSPSAAASPLCSAQTQQGVTVAVSSVPLAQQMDPLAQAAPFCPSGAQSSPARGGYMRTSEAVASNHLQPLLFPPPTTALGLPNQPPAPLLRLRVCALGSLRGVHPVRQRQRLRGGRLHLPSRHAPAPRRPRRLRRPLHRRRRHHRSRPRR